ncbi:ABC-F family ATP-binding cassette domain-containing protein [Taibaiella lutea]|uniref:ABC-F family ATP-binding cassette domain-containing protein n=1 Tax=Taibaiella lutea TaxID=2608001 RepID=A0A5M6CTT7_9BACT|nr:ABC-F family ATP-binding cassette domain-containing protein [Taibaiella lutea]KAA5536425.1 ABC-F family ATP-binding cassette domain-containing protein [Taibaiella lutea]
MLLALNNVSFSFGARPMLTEANWQIGENERIGLIGPNGAGKSTLLRLIMGEYSIDGGNIQRANDTTIGFFNQDLLSFSTDNSILSVGMTAFEKAVAIEKTMESIMKDLETNGDDEDLLLAYSEALHDFEMAGGYEMEHRTAEVLEGLGFSTKDLQRPYNNFSGGWRMRVLLAKLMLQQPDILMLDEPTNHLDLPSIEWLERYLTSYPGTVIIVSHDRYFLDRMVTRIVELFQQDLISYSGNYSFYEVEKATRMEFLEREYENQQKYIDQQERFIERFKAKASKAKQAQSLVKKLDKIERIEMPGGSGPRMNISFDVEKQPGKIIVDLKNVSKSYGDVNILKHANAEIDRGDKIALVGANGKGKSTLMRIIADMESFEGERSGWHNVKASFYAQHQLESLHLENTLLEEMKNCGSGKTELELRQLLGCFLFAGDDVFKKIKVLSGGEKARVALAKVIAGKANFLLLDEPTNHLDIQSVELLIEALNKYQGTYILISHDRYFVSRTANKYWEIEDGKVNAFPGTYDEWHDWKEEKAERLKQLGIAKQEPKKVAEVKKEVKPVDSKEQNDKKKELQKQQKAFEKIEVELGKAEAAKAKLEQDMGNPEIYADKEKFQKTEAEYKLCVSHLEKVQKEYDTVFEKMIELEA